MDIKNKNKTSKPKTDEGIKFKSKKIKHDPQAEGARAKFGLNSTTPQEK